MRRYSLLLALLVLLPALPAAAEEIIHFNNGATMAIRAHELEGDMIRVNLGAGAVMAFPVSMVERVVKGGQDVFTGPGYEPSNQAVAGEKGIEKTQVRVTRDNTITGSGDIPARFRSGGRTTGVRTGDPDSYTAAASANASTRAANPFGPAARFRRASAPPRNLGETPIGTYAMGDTLVLGTPNPDASQNKPTILHFGPKEAVGSASAGESSSGGEAGASPEND